MVDLGFLLITFFIFTTSLSHPHITRLILPREGELTPFPESKALTLLLCADNVFVYEGQWEDALTNLAVQQTTYNLQTGIGIFIRQKQQKLSQKEDLLVLIKPLPSASYQNVISALDELQINGVKNYALLNASAEETKVIQMR